MASVVEAIIFDVEGTLIDCISLVLECWRQTLAKHGFDFSIDELHRFSGMDAKLMLASLLPHHDQKLIKQLIDEQGERYRKEFMPAARPFPDARAAVAHLSKHEHQIALATTSQPDELRHYLKLLGIAEFVTATVCGDDVRKEKPAPDLIIEAIKRLPRKPQRAIAVGDTPYDAEAALAARATPLGVLTGGFDAAELNKAGCAMVIPGLSDLAGAIHRTR
jgi:phosphoglycolate phosphatase-like HAD superfamily hydrolase